MKELIINIPEDAVEFVEEFVERIGGIVENSKNKRNSKSGEKVTEVLPLDSFGTWPDIPLDPKTYRKRLWRKTPGL
jgi:hypothetical protein